MTNWSCNICTFQNASTKTTCDMCGTSQNSTTYTGSWQCTKCTFLNENARQKCEMCNDPKPGTNTTTTTTTTTTTSTYQPTTTTTTTPTIPTPPTTITKPEPIKKKDDSVACKYCTMKNDKEATRCVACNKWIKHPNITYSDYTGERCTNWFEYKDLLRCFKSSRFIEETIPEEEQDEILEEITEFIGLTVWDIDSKAKDIDISIINYQRFCHLEEDDEREKRYCTIAMNHFIDPLVERQDNIYTYYFKFQGEIQKNSRELSIGVITDDWATSWNDTKGVGDDPKSWGLYSSAKDRCHFYHDGKQVEGIQGSPGLPRCPTEKDLIEIEINPKDNYIKFKLDGRGGGETRLSMDQIKKINRPIRLAVTFLCKHNMIGLHIQKGPPQKKK